MVYFIATRGGARTRGRQHGEALAEPIARAIVGWAGGPDLPPAGVSIEHWLRQHCPDACEEMLGIAEGADQPYEAILLLTIKNSLSFLACTTMVVRGVDGRCVLGKTQDVGPVEAEFQLVQELTTEDGRRAVVVGLVGTTWAVCGMNGEGLCVGCNSAPSLREAAVPAGLPQHQALYPLLKHQATVHGALGWWLARPLVGKGINGCLCDRVGDAVSFERAGARYAVTRSAGSLFHVNHYRDPAMQAEACRPASENSLAREAHLTERLAGRVFDDPAAEARAILLETAADGSVCRPPNEAGEGTHSAFVADPQEGSFAVCEEPAVAAEWRIYRL